MLKVDVNQKTLKMIEFIFVGVFIVLGVWASIGIGVTWDEDSEFNTLLLNWKAVYGLLQGSTDDYQALINYRDRYYGVGFHIVSGGLSFLLSHALPNLSGLDDRGWRLVLTHIPIFLSFVASGYLLRFLLLRFTQSQLTALLGMLAFLLWPYLLGHSLMNVKDIPFLFVWLLCTIECISVLDLLESSTNKYPKRLIYKILLLGFLTAWLFSIRVTGVLIFIEFGFLFLSRKVFGFPKFLFSNIKITILAVIFSTVFLAGLVLFSPIYWHNPIEFFNAIRFMSHHSWDGNTLTAGRLVDPKTQLYFYVSNWFLVKAPLIVLLGIMLIPVLFCKNIFQYKKILGEKKRIILLDHQADFIGLIASTGCIILLLMAIRVGIYNELRHLLFLFPFAYLIGVSTLYYFNKKLVNLLLLLSIGLFIFDDIRLYPYQYTYLNEVSRQFNVAEKYEKDYFGVSALRSAQWLNGASLDLPRKICIYADPVHLWEHAINKDKYQCIKNYSTISDEKNLFLFYWITRNDFGRLLLPSCRLIHAEKKLLPFSNAELIMGQLYVCDPKVK